MKYLGIIFIISIIFSCNSKRKIDLKSDIKPQSSIYVDYRISEDSIIFRIKNNIHAPIRLSLKNSDETLKNRFGVVTIQKLTDTILAIRNTNLKEKNLEYNVILGDLQKQIISKKLNLPFANGKSYSIMQGQNGNFSHNADESRFAIDLAMKVGDTVYSADEGYVVGVIDYNDKYGNSQSFEKYANFVTIYNDNTGVYLQYVHLKKNEIFVKVGDKIKQNQPLALVGLSGFLDGEHLHFNAKIPTGEGMKSIPFDFQNYNGKELYRGQIVSH